MCIEHCETKTGQKDELGPELVALSKTKNTLNAILMHWYKRGIQNNECIIYESVDQIDIAKSPHCHVGAIYVYLCIHFSFVSPPTSLIKFCPNELPKQARAVV